MLAKSNFSSKTLYKMNSKEQGGFLPSSEIRKNNGKSEGKIVAFYYIEI